MNRFQNPQPSVLPDKWQFDSSQDWGVLRDDFDSVSLNTIPDVTLQALGFHFSPLGYFEEGALRFVDVTDDLDLTIELVDNGQPITNSKDEKVRKQNKCVAERKARLDNLHAPVRAPAAGSAACSSSRPAPVSRPGSPAPSSSRLGSPTRSSPLPSPISRPLPAPVLGSPAVLSSLPVLGPAPPHLTSSSLRIFKRALSDEPLRRRSTSPAQLLCLFPPLGSLSDKTDRKRTFDKAFINSRLLASNHDRDEVDLRFAECGYTAAVKLNRLW